MAKLSEKYSSNELIVAAECLENYGEYSSVDFVGYTPEELRQLAKVSTIMTQNNVSDKDFDKMSCKELAQAQDGKSYLYSCRCRKCQHFRRDCVYVS